MKAAILALVLLAGPVAAHEPYLGLTRPGMNLGCCSSQNDCRPLAPEEWRNVSGDLQILIDGAWVAVDPAVIQDVTIDSQMHACIQPRHLCSPLENCGSGSGSFIRCVIPPAGN